MIIGVRGKNCFVGNLFFITLTQLSYIRSEEFHPFIWGKIIWLVPIMIICLFVISLFYKELELPRKLYLKQTNKCFYKGGELAQRRKVGNKDIKLDNISTQKNACPVLLTSCQRKTHNFDPKPPSNQNKVVNKTIYMTCSIHEREKCIYSKMNSLFRH